MNHNETRMVMLQTERHLLKSAEKYNYECISSTVKCGGRGAFSAAGIDELLHYYLMLLNTGEYYMTRFPQMNSSFLKS